MSVTIHPITPTAAIHHGDCVEAMRRLPDASVDAIVTDPPYGINFLGKAWDGAAIAEAAARDAAARRDLGPESATRPGRSEPRSASAFGNGAGQAGAYDLSVRGNRAFQAWTEAWATEALRVLKPGGHLVSFASTRTYHRMAAGIEDAGFVLRDQLAWMFGQGFPKSLDAARAVTAQVTGGASSRTAIRQASMGDEYEPTVEAGQGGSRTTKGLVTAPPAQRHVAPEAEPWVGWGTCLKPAYEPIALARKPLDGTVAQNLLAHGVGALNIDGCRVEGVMDGTWGGTMVGSEPGFSGGYSTDYRTQQHEAGRWPANVLCDEAAGAIIDAEAGERGGGFGVRGAAESSRTFQGSFQGDGREVGYGDAGGPSRFFYQPKANTAERAAGLPTGEGNEHPTVKPIDLMRWLCRLITPPGGVVLDPFLGSGTTGCAAVLEGFGFIGCEREADYLRIAEARVRWWAQREGADTAAAVAAGATERAVAEAGQLGLGL